MQSAALGQPTSAPSQPAWVMQPPGPSGQAGSLYEHQGHTYLGHQQLGPGNGQQQQQQMLPAVQMGFIMHSQGLQQQAPIQEQIPAQQQSAYQQQGAYQQQVPAQQQQQVQVQQQEYMPYQQQPLQPQMPIQQLPQQQHAAVIQQGPMLAQQQPLQQQQQTPLPQQVPIFAQPQTQQQQQQVAAAQASGAGPYQQQWSSPTGGIASVQDAMNSAIQRSRDMSVAFATPDHPNLPGQGRSQPDQQQAVPDPTEAAQASLLACLPPHLQAAVAPPPQIPGVDPICGPLYAKPIPPNVLAVTVNKADAFKCDTMVTNPVVRMHVLDPSTGEYMRSLMPPGIQLDPATQELMLRYPGRPAAVTVGNNAALPQPALQEYLPPAQTAPFNLLRRGDPGAVAVWGETLLVDEALERLVALDALIVFEVLQLPVSFHRFLKHPDEFRSGVHRVAWAFLRLAGNPQPPGSPAAGAGSPAVDPAAMAAMMLGAQCPVGPDGAPVSTHTHLLGDLKLQLYRYRPEPMLPGNRAAVQAAEEKLSGAPTRAFTAWKALMSSYARGPPSSLPTMGLVDKYPAALHITLAAAPRPPPEVVCVDPPSKLRAVLPAGYGSGFEQGSVPLLQFMAEVSYEQTSLLQFMAEKFGTSGVGSAAAITGGMTGTSLEKSPYYRSKGEACMLPNKQWRQLATGPGGATALMFSWDGGRVAVAVGHGQRAETFHILVYSTVSCAELARMHCAHQGWVHSLCWSKDDTALLSASADGTAKVWEMALFDTASRTIRPRVLRHAAPVYAAIFHPLTHSHPIIVTAGKSGSLHVWHRFSGQQLACVPYEASVNTVTAAWSTAAAVIDQEPAGVRAPRRTGSVKGGRGELLGAVHALAFDMLGTRLWAADQHGSIQEFGVDGAAITATVQRLTSLAATTGCIQAAPYASQPHPQQWPLQVSPACASPGADHPGMMPQGGLQPPAEFVGAPCPMPAGQFEFTQPCWQAGPDPTRPAVLPNALPNEWSPDDQQRHWAATQPPCNLPADQQAVENDPQCMTLMGPPVKVYAHLGGPVSYQQLPPASPTPPPPPPPPCPVAGQWGGQENGYLTCGVVYGAAAGMMQSSTGQVGWSPSHVSGPGPMCEGVEVQQQWGQGWGTGAAAAGQLPVQQGWQQQGVQQQDWSQKGVQQLQMMQPVQQSCAGYMQYTVHPDPQPQSQWNAPLAYSNSAALHMEPQQVANWQSQHQQGLPPQYSMQQQPGQQQPRGQGVSDPCYPAQMGQAMQPPMPGAQPGLHAQANQLAAAMPAAQQGLYSQHQAVQAAAAPLTSPLPGPLLRSMRSCQAVAGQPVASLTLHPTGRKLIVLTHANRMVTLDTRAFREARDLGRVKCKSSGLVKAAISPDGAYVIAGGEDGVVRAWDADCVDDDVPSVTLPHLGCGRPIACVAWNPQMQMVAVSSWGSWSPLLLAVYDPSLKSVEPLTSDGLVRTEIYPHKSEAPGKQYALPEQLTPALVHALLADVRAGARQRGLLPAPPLDPMLTQHNHPGNHLRLDGSPNTRGAYGEPYPHPVADQLVVCKPRPEDVWHRQQAEQAAVKAAQVAEEAARLAGRLTFSTPPNAVPDGRPVTAMQQMPGGQSVPPQLGGIYPSPQAQQVQGMVPEGLGSHVPLSQATYTPSAGGLTSQDDLNTPRAAAFAGSGPLHPPAGPDGLPLPAADLHMYSPNLRGAVRDGPVGVRESVLIAGSAVSPQPYPADTVTPTRPRPRPLHELPELANKSFSAANPPQQHLQPIMAGPGATVIVGPGATVVAHEGATVMPAVDPLAGYVPNVSQRPYEMRLSTPLPAVPQPVGPPVGSVAVGQHVAVQTSPAVTSPVSQPQQQFQQQTPQQQMQPQTQQAVAQLLPQQSQSQLQMQQQGQLQTQAQGQLQGQPQTQQQWQQQQLSTSSSQQLPATAAPAGMRPSQSQVGAPASVPQAQTSPGSPTSSKLAGEPSRNPGTADAAVLNSLAKLVVAPQPKQDSMLTSPGSPTANLSNSNGGMATLAQPGSLGSVAGKPGAAVVSTADVSKELSRPSSAGSGRLPASQPYAMNDQPGQKQSMTGVVSAGTTDAAGRGRAANQAQPVKQGAPGGYSSPAAAASSATATSGTPSSTLFSSSTGSGGNSPSKQPATVAANSSSYTGTVTQPAMISPSGQQSSGAPRTGVPGTSTGLLGSPTGGQPSPTLTPGAATGQVGIAPKPVVQTGLVGSPTSTSVPGSSSITSVGKQQAASSASGAAQYRPRTQQDSDDDDTF